MSKGFNLQNTISGKLSIDKASDKVKDIGIQKEFKYIEVDKIIPSQKNFYGLRDLEDLTESIIEYGVLQPLLLEKVESDNDKYNLISGHRRLEASICAGLQAVPAYIKTSTNDIDFEIMLIHANKQRIKNDMERATEIRKLKVLIEIKKGTGEITGRTMDIVANITGTSRSQAHRLDKLNNLIPELQKLIETEDLPASTAENFSNMPIELQKFLFNKIKEEGIKLSRNEAVSIRTEFEDKIKSEEVKNKMLKELVDEQKNSIKIITSEKEQAIASLKSKLENAKTNNPPDPDLISKIEKLENELLQAKHNSLRNNETNINSIKNIHQMTMIEACKINIASISQTVNEIKKDGISEENTPELKKLKNSLLTIIDILCEY